MAWRARISRAASGRISPARENSSRFRPAGMVDATTRRTSGWAMRTPCSSMETSFALSSASSAASRSSDAGSILRTESAVASSPQTARACRACRASGSRRSVRRAMRSASRSGAGSLLSRDQAMSCSTCRGHRGRAASTVRDGRSSAKASTGRGSSIHASRSRGSTGLVPGAYVTTSNPPDEGGSAVRFDERVAAGAVDEIDVVDHEDDEPLTRAARRVRHGPPERVGHVALARGRRSLRALRGLRGISGQGSVVGRIPESLEPAPRAGGGAEVASVDGPCRRNAQQPAYRLAGRVSRDLRPRGIGADVDHHVAP